MIATGLVIWFAIARYLWVTQNKREYYGRSYQR